MPQEKYLKIGEFAKKVNTKIGRLRYLNSKNIFKPAFVSESGHRYYTSEQIKEFFQREKNSKKFNVYLCIKKMDLSDDLQNKIKNAEKILAPMLYPFKTVIVNDRPIKEVETAKMLSRLFELLSSPDIKCLYMDHENDSEYMPLIVEFCKTQNVEIKFIAKKGI